MSQEFKTLLRKGMAHFSAGQIEEALAALKAAYAFEKDHATLNYFLAVIAEQQNDPKTAEFHYRKVVDLDPTMRQAHIQLADALYRQGNKAEALNVLCAAEKLFPNDHDILFTRGQVAMHLLPGWHLPMLSDHERNNAYEKAINAQIKSTDIVLDIGTGSGLLAMMAARAGAAHVYACEVDPTLAELARQIIRQNGYQDRISVINKHSRELVVGQDIAEKCDVLLTEIFDRAIVGEGALPTISHAREHLLKPDARSLPQRATIYGAFVECAHLQKFHHIGDVNGFDLRAMNVLSHPLAYKEALIGLEESEEHNIISAPFVIKNLDFESKVAINFHSKCSVDIIKEGKVDAILLWFDLHLDENNILSTHRPRPNSHWRQAAQILLNPLTVSAGMKVQLQTHFKGYFDFDLKV